MTTHTHSFRTRQGATTLATLLLTLCCAPALAGGYMRSGGEAFASAGFQLDFNDRYFDKAGKRQDGGCAAGYSVPLYVDYGWSYYTNVFANTSLRYKDCPGQSASSMGDSEIGVRRRVNPLSDKLVWQASLMLPTSRIGATRPSDAAVLGYDLGLHWRPRPDPYRLDVDKDPLAGGWDVGTGLRGWASHLPLEWWAYASYGRALGLTDWASGKRAWSFYATLDWRQSIAREQARGPAVDAHDDFHLLGLSVGFSYPLARHERLGVSFYQALKGENRDDSSGITLSYGKTFP